MLKFGCPVVATNFFLYITFVIKIKNIKVMTKLETLPTINKDGQLSRRFNNLEAAILIWKKREVRMIERINAGEHIDYLSRNMYIDTQWKVLDKIYEMWPECQHGYQGANLLNDMGDKLYQIYLEISK